MLHLCFSPKQVLYTAVQPHGEMKLVSRHIAFRKQVGFLEVLDHLSPHREGHAAQVPVELRPEK